MRADDDDDPNRCDWIPDGAQGLRANQAHPHLGLSRHSGQAPTWHRLPIPTVATSSNDPGSPRLSDQAMAGS